MSEFTVGDEIYERRDDMSQTGKLQVCRDNDGDLIVGVFKGDGPNGDSEENGWVSVEFCALGSGGGRSHHTRKALLDLIVAIQKDNQERPIIDLAL